MKLEGRVAIVTGGGSGIGQAAAIMMAAEGARVAIDARRAERCAETVDEILKAGGEAFAVPGDVSDPKHVEDLVAQTIGRWGRLDIVVPNAGVNGVWCPIEELTPEEWDQVQAVNGRGTFLTVKYAIPHLRESGGGSIVIISSVNGTRNFSYDGVAAYASSKALQVAFTKVAAYELAQWKIRVNVVCPGATKTKIGENTTWRNLEKIRNPDRAGFGSIPLGYTAESEQIARTILFLASDDSDYITGTEVWIDGGLSLASG